MKIQPLFRHKQFASPIIDASGRPLWPLLSPKSKGLHGKFRFGTMLEPCYLLSSSLGASKGVPFIHFDKETWENTMSLGYKAT